MWASSRSRYAVFTGTTIRPSRSAATYATTRSTDACALRITRSPGNSPAPARLPATRRVRSSSCAAVTQPAASLCRSCLSGASAHFLDHARVRLTSRSRSMSASAHPAGRWRWASAALRFGEPVIARSMSPAPSRRRHAPRGGSHHCRRPGPRGRRRRAVASGAVGSPLASRPTCSAARDRAAARRPR